MSRAPADLTGHRFGRLEVIGRVGTEKDHLWLCRCDCGQIVAKAAKRMTGGRRPARSCGCLRAISNRATKTTHGRSFSAEYRSWQGMLGRCRNANHQAFRNYGGRGISVCERWLSFANFLVDMGPRPEGRTLDRINNDGNYEPGNCRWATASEQARNKRPAPRGQDCAGAKLNDSLAREIRARRTAGERVKDLAVVFGVHPNTITLVANRRWWSHVA